MYFRGFVFRGGCVVRGEWGCLGLYWRRGVEEGRRGTEGVGWMMSLTGWCGKEPFFIEMGGK